MTRFPVGGPRGPVDAFFREHGFTIPPDSFGDKHWVRADGLRAHLYGSGSKVRIFRNNQLIADGPLEETLVSTVAILGVLYDT